ncbi:hypothetical protein EDD11_003582 [Mortierella claussenii]|nr:hypothetical protein EDD11_003582 [Mortierella claussenii]
MQTCLSDSLLQLIPTCIIVFSSLAFISAECGRQDRRRHFNRFSSEVVVQGESLADLEIESSSSNRLIKPRRTFSLALLRCIGAFSQIALFVYLATQKIDDLNSTGPEPGIPTNSTDEPRLLRKEINEEWPLWLPVMHGIVWVYASILSVVSLLHPRLSNPYKLPTHLDVIYLTTTGAGLTHFMQSNFGRPIGLWTLDDQISGLSTVISGLMIILTLATKPLVPPQPSKGPEKRSRGVISPETRSSLYSRVAFTWLHPMVLKSFTEKLQEADVWAIDKELKMKTVFQEYLEYRKPTVFYTMLHLFRFDLAQQYLWALAWAGLSMVPPFVVFQLLEFAQDVSTYNQNEAMFYVAALLVSIIVRSAVLQRGLHMGQRIGTKAMGMATTLIYEKMSLRKDMDPAEYDITDLIAVDIKHIGQGWKQGFHLMIYPTMFALATVQLYGYIGHSAWAGGLAVVAWYPISAVASFLFSGRFDAVEPKVDRSNALVSDVLANLKAIKFLGWEEVLLSKVIKAREEERRYNSKSAQPVMALISVPLGGDLIHAFVMTITLSAFSIYFGQRLTPAILFTILILVDIQTNAINSLPAVVITIKEMLDSVVRVNDFLLDDENERDTAIIRDREMARRANIPVIGFVNASFIWPVAKPARHNNELLFVEEPEEEEDSQENGGSSGRAPRGKKSSKNSRHNISRVNANWIIRTLSLFGYSLPQQPEPHLPPNAHLKYGMGFGGANTSAYDFVLKDVSVAFPPGQVSLVTGTKKSGKSALLLALIGEMTRTSGKIYLPRKDYYHGKQGYGSDVAYVAQDPWLEIGGGGSITGSSTGRSTIRDTILFSCTMDDERYTQVLRACVLEDELRGLPNGDMTIIGERNVIWSMSLKQRISLARAVYSDVSHVLMDDCLSFVDVKSRQFIWKNCLLGPLMQNKTRIIVANQFHVKMYLSDVDYVVGLDQGIVLGHGSVKDVLSQGWIRQAPGSSSIPTTIIPGASVPANMGQIPPTQQPLSDTVLTAPAHDLRPSKSTNLPLNKMSSLSDYDDLDSTLSRETAAGFKIGWRTFGTYIFSLGTAVFLLSAFMSLFLSQALFVIRIGWLGIWAENEPWDGGVPLLIHRGQKLGFVPDNDAPTKATLSHYDYIMIFIALAAARALFVVANAFFLRGGAHAGADRMYARLLQSLASARLSVFEPNPEKAATSLPGDAGGLFSKGTINGIKDCFQRDLSGLDVKLAKEFWQFSSDLLAVTLILLVLVWTLPFALVPAAVVLFMLSTVALLGLGLSKEMHRMAIRADRMNRDQFKHTFRGLATIRGYGLERRAIKAGMAQAEVYLKTSYFGSCADRWLHWKVDLFGAFIPFSCAVMVLQRIENMDPVLMGLSLYLSLQFSDKALDTLLGYGRIRNRLQWALERTRRYIHELEYIDNREGPRVVLNKQPPAGWPHSGTIEYINYSCKRSDIVSASATAKITNKTPFGLSTLATADQVEVVEIRERAFPEAPHPVQNLNQQPNQYSSQQAIQYANWHPNQYPSQYLNQYINQYPRQVSSQNPSQYAAQGQYQGQDQHANQYGGQYPSHYPSQPVNQYPGQNQYPTQYQNHGQYSSQGQQANQYSQGQGQGQGQGQYQNPARVPLPTDLSLSAPRESGSIRTNTAVSAVNTVASNTSHFSAATGTSAVTNETMAGSQHNYPSASENSIATLVPLPTPSATFVSTDSSADGTATESTAPIVRTKSAAVPDTGAPIDQLEALNQTDPQSDIISRYDAPLPPLPPSAPSTVGPSAGDAVTAALKTPDSDEPVAQPVTDGTSGFGPITCTIQPGEKIAVVGQSRSGKSTFIHSLFRIWDFAKEERIRAARASQLARPPKKSASRKAKSFHDNDPDLGMIKVDGSDIAQIGLADLRPRFGYLAPRGTVLAGTVRFNLDPRGEHEDAELNEVLKTCFLSDRIKLDMELITPATAHLTSVVHGTASSTSLNAAAAVEVKSTSRLAKYRKHFLRKSHAMHNDGNKSKGKDKKKDYRATASAPATIGVSSSRGLLAAMEGGDAEVEQRLLTSLDEDSDENARAEVYGNDSEEEEEEEDMRVELDTNERQLLSLARILIQRPNVVVLDNAASKVTDLTAQRLDQIIVQELKHATVISLGHRLDQIVVRHNRILVLNHGKIAEFDTPIALLQKPNGAFRAICNPDSPNFPSLVSLAKKQQSQLQLQLQS